MRHRRRHHSRRHHFGRDFARDSQGSSKSKKGKANAYGKHTAAVAAYAKSLDHNVGAMMQAGIIGRVSGKTWDKKKKKPIAAWKVLAKKAFGKKHTTTGRKKTSSSGRSRKSGKRRGMPYRMTGFKSANTWLDKIIGVVKSAVAVKPRLRGSDYLMKHKLKLDALEKKLERGIVVLKQKEADEDRSKAERAKATAERKQAQAAKKAVSSSKAKVVAVIRENGRKEHLEKGESEDEYQDRIHRGVSGPRRPDRWVEGDKGGRPRKKGAKKKSSKGKKHGKGRKLSRKTKDKMASKRRAYWRKVNALRGKGYSLKRAQSALRSEKKTGKKSSPKKRSSAKKRSSKKRSSAKKRSTRRDWSGSF